VKKALQNNIPSIDTMDIIPGVDAADINHFFHEVKILEGGGRCNSFLLGFILMCDSFLFGWGI